MGRQRRRGWRSLQNKNAKGERAERAAAIAFTEREVGHLSAGQIGSREQGRRSQSSAVSRRKSTGRMAAAICVNA